MLEISEPILQAIANFQVNLPVLLKCLGVLLFVHLVNIAIGRGLLILGIVPRHLLGVGGIFAAPFLHASFEHLFLNSIVFFILGGFVMMSGVNPFLWLTAYLTVSSGLLIWLFGRMAIHVGASSVIMGYFGFLIRNAIYSHNIAAILILIVCLYFLGSLLLSVLPGERGVSWEGHLFGLIAGLVSIEALPLFKQYIHLLSGIDILPIAHL